MGTDRIGEKQVGFRSLLKMASNLKGYTLIEPKLNEEAVGDQRSALSLRIWKVFLYLIYTCFINVEVKNINLTADC